MRKILAIALIAVLAHYAWTSLGPGEGVEFSPSSADSVLSEAFETGQSGVQVRGEGRVLRVLADDNDGSRHQRFILELDSGQSLLMAHNIDLAPRIPGLQIGDTVEFFGEYEWNAKGGVIHWTHHDPGGRHVAGWLKHHGRTYQ